MLSAGLAMNPAPTLQMLCDWADRVICTDCTQGETLNLKVKVAVPEKLQLWDIGPDIYKRPFNPELPPSPSCAR